MGLSSGGGICIGFNVEIVDGELGFGDGYGEERKGVWRKGCYVCLEELLN